MKPIIIGVAGGTGSGKTSVSEAILERVGREQITYIQHDSYYKALGRFPLEERHKIDFNHPDALDTNLLVEHLERLQAGSPVEMPIYDFATYQSIFVPYDDLYGSHFEDPRRRLPDASRGSGY